MSMQVGYSPPVCFMKGTIPVNTVQQRQKRSASGVKTIALDTRMVFAQYRLAVLLSVSGSATFALVLHILFLR